MLIVHVQYTHSCILFNWITDKSNQVHLAYCISWNLGTFANTVFIYQRL